MRKPAQDPGYAPDFEQVLAAEQALITARRQQRGLPADAPQSGLALSEGGVRSAAFGLGVMRAVHERSAYRELDYLSTVSGGGFTGTFVHWLRRRANQLRVEHEELLPASALRFVRHSADYMRPVPISPHTGGVPGHAGAAPTSTTVQGVVLGQMLLSLAVWASLLTGLFLALHVADGVITLLAPLLLLATRNDVWRFCVEQLTFGAVAGLLALGLGAVRIVLALLLHGWRVTSRAFVPSAGSPHWADAWRGALWFLLALVTGALGITALGLFGEALRKPPPLGLAPLLADWLAPLLATPLFTSVSIFAFVRCRARWDARIVDPRPRAVWLLIPLFAALLLAATLLGLLGYYLLSSGEGAAGDPPVLGPVGLLVALAVVVLGSLALVPAALRTLRRVLARMPVPVEPKASYRRSLTLQRKTGRTLAWASAWFVLGSIPWWERFAYARDGSRDLYIHVFAAGIALGTLWLCRRVVSSARVARASSRRLSPGLRSLLLGLVLYGLLVFAHGLTAEILESSLPSAVLWIVGGGLGLGFLAELNFAGAGGIHRNRLAETFMPEKSAVAQGAWQPAFAAADFRLAALAEQDEHGPYPLLNTSLVTDGSTSHAHTHRGSDSFVLSPLFCGSSATGWAETRRWQRGGLTLRDALAISGSATAPGAGLDKHGVGRSWLVALGLAVFNLRFLYVADNPNPAYARPSRLRPNLLFPGLTSVLFGQAQSERARRVRLADGGHFDALGIYELLRRKLSLIIVSDASEDPELDFRALGNVLARAREDLSVVVEFERGKLFGQSERTGLYGAPAKPGVAARGFALGTIHYADQSVGVLVYLKPALVEGLDVSLQSFALANPEFPRVPRPDRPFDERQFGAYEELGFALAGRALDQHATHASESLESLVPPHGHSYMSPKAGGTQETG